MSCRLVTLAAALGAAASLPHTYGAYDRETTGACRSAIFLLRQVHSRGRRVNTDWLSHAGSRHALHAYATNARVCSKRTDEALEIDFRRNSNFERE